MYTSVIFQATSSAIIKMCNFAKIFVIFLANFQDTSVIEPGCMFHVQSIYIANEEICQFTQSFV